MGRNQYVCLLDVEQLILLHILDPTLVKGLGILLTLWVLVDYACACMTILKCTMGNCCSLMLIPASLLFWCFIPSSNCHMIHLFEDFAEENHILCNKLCFCIKLWHDFLASWCNSNHCYGQCWWCRHVDSIVNRKFYIFYIEIGIA